MFRSGDLGYRDADGWVYPAGRRTDWMRDDAELSPAEFEQFLAAQPDLPPKAWPRWVRISSDLPVTATNKILEREPNSQGATAAGGVLWERRGRTHFEDVAR